MSNLKSLACLSIIIPVYNEAQTIRDVIKKVQSVPLPIEIILVDDKSTDGTTEILKQLDPEFYSEIDLNNVKRLQRAIEVCMLTGEKFSDIRKGNKQTRPFYVLKIGLNREREELFDRINQRVDLMFQDGLIEEVKSVVKFKTKNALKTVGYTEIFDYLNNEVPLEEAKDKIKVNTRRYAKRQIGWLNKSSDYKWFHPDDFKKIIDYISLNIN